MTASGRFQFLPPLNADDYAALKADIAKRGVVVAVEYDEAGQIIDGYNRVQICKELGIRDYPIKVRSYPNDIAKRSQARRLNLLRRHLDAKTKRALIKAELEDNPDQSDLQIAKLLGVSDHTVAKVRKSGSQSANQKTRTDKRGRKQPATKPTRPKQLSLPVVPCVDASCPCPTCREARRKQTAPVSWPTPSSIPSPDGWGISMVLKDLLLMPTETKALMVEAIALVGAENVREIITRLSAALEEYGSRGNQPPPTDERTDR
jgi:hypothetical protein